MMNMIIIIEITKMSKVIIMIMMMMMVTRCKHCLFLLPCKKTDHLRLLALSHHYSSSCQERLLQLAARELYLEIAPQWLSGSTLHGKTLAVVCIDMCSNMGWLHTF